MSSASDERVSYDYSHHYRTWHDDTVQHRREMVRWHHAQLEPLVGHGQGAPALDIGCGMGFTVRALQELGYTATGVDADRSQVEACRAAGLDVELVGDLSPFLSGRSAHYAVVTMLDVLEHLPSAQHIATARAIRDSLGPGGKLVLTVPNANSPVAPRWRYIDWTHETAFTEHSLRFVLLNAGFRDIRILPSYQPRRPPLRLWQKPRRQEFRQWAVRALWRQVLVAELGDNAETRSAPIDLNLTCVAEV